MIQLLTGDCRDVLPTLLDASVHCVVTSPPYYALRSYLHAEHPDKHREIGSEPTPDAYIATMVAVFREVKRVLRPDGTCWVNMGDSYSNGSIGRNDMDDATLERRAAQYGTGRGPGAGPREPSRPRPMNGAKPKDLLMMPARLALALQADGWWLRSDIIWAKPNPMPESCTDRPTSAHEHVFLLTKRARYWYDADAVREPHTEGTHSRGGIKDITDGFVKAREWNKLPPTEHPAGRNLRNVWTIATHAFPQAHFATYPPELVERCIRAGTSERGCCAVCGAPWVRQTAVSYTNAGNGNNNMKRKGGGDYEAAMSARPYEVRKLKDVETTGWRASCTCDAEVVPATILDPFLGSGTTALVADRLQRHCIGIDLSTTYADLARARIEADAPLFTSWAPAEPPEDERMRDLFAEAAE